MTNKQTKLIKELVKNLRKIALFADLANAECGEHSIISGDFGHVNRDVIYEGADAALLFGSFNLFKSVAEMYEAEIKSVQEENEIWTLHTFIADGIMFRCYEKKGETE